MDGYEEEKPWNILAEILARLKELEKKVKYLEEAVYSDGK